jgi:hypothetical protein
MKFAGMRDGYLQYFDICSIFVLEVGQSLHNINSPMTVSNLMCNFDV